jgi:MtrB/PioB family decaheme-associated outer membrane protein
MRRYVLVHLMCGIGLVVPAAAVAQTAAQTAAKPPLFTGTPQTPAPQTPAPTTPAAAPDEAAAGEPTGSLFDETWHQFELAGRFSSIDGDPARFQRYQDLRDGLLFTKARYAKEGADGAWTFRAAGDNVGWRDQRFFADYEQTGKFLVTGVWDQIPQFYSVDTKTPYNRPGNPLELDDATQLKIQNGQGGSVPLNNWIPLANQFDLRERRDIGHVSFLMTPSQTIDVKAEFTTQKHSGELPWGASFGFGNDVEVPLPYDSRTNDFTVGAEWTNMRQMIRVAYDGSWFDNLDDTLVWDSPLRLADSTSAPGRGRTALWPSNSAQTVSIGGYTKFAKRTQLTGFFSYGVRNNDEPLLPFTINTALTPIALPRATADASANITSVNLNLVSRDVEDWRFAARLRHYGYDNQMPHTAIPNFINYDTSVKASATGGPENYAHGRTDFDADATWTGLNPVALTAGYGHHSTSHEFRIFEDTGEDVFRLSADAAGLQFFTFRATWELSDRTGSGLDEELLVTIGEQPGLRHYDLADRSRNKFTGQVDASPNEFWTFSASGGVGKDDYDDSQFGLQESTFRTISFAADYQAENGFGGGASYNYERYAGLQRSRSANPDATFNDPNRDWTADSRETVHYFSIYAKPPKFHENTEARLSYDWSHAEGSYLYGVVPGGPLPPPSQLPNVFNKLQQLHVDVRHRLNNRLAATFSYLYEPFRVYDFAFDPSVINSIAQPSSLVMGYVYRPYTANSFTAGIRYIW